MVQLGNIFVVLVIFLQITYAKESVTFRNETRLHRSRREAEDSKRYLIFPQGSNVQLVYCLTIGTYAKPSSFFTVGATAGLAWELPHRNSVPYRRPAEVYHRRSRRDLYRKIELMLSTYGKDGKACVRKALCKAGTRNKTEIGRGTFVQEILHSIFTLPDGSYDVDPKTVYEESFHASHDEENCKNKYPTCPDEF